MGAQTVIWTFMTKWSEWEKGGWSMSLCSLLFPTLSHDTRLPNESISYRKIWIQALMSLASLITLHLYICVLITLMLVNLFVLSVNLFVNSCNVLYICKESSVINLIWYWQVVFSYNTIKSFAKLNLRQVLVKMILRTF